MSTEVDELIASLTENPVDSAAGVATDETKPAEAGPAVLGLTISDATVERIVDICRFAVSTGGHPAQLAQQIMFDLGKY